MRYKKVANYGVYLLSIIAASFVIVGVAGDAFAQNPINVINSNGQICANYTGLTARFVNCIQGTVAWALDNYLGTYISYFVTTVNVVMTFAVVVYAFFVLTGRAQPAGREAIKLLITIGFIVFFINLGNYSSMFPVLVDTVNWVLGLVTNYTAIQMSPHCPYSPFIWNRVDCALNMLIGGIFPPTTISFGLGGFILAMLFSGGIGVAFFFFGIGIILSTLLAILQAMFVLISANIALAMLSLLAPIMIPLILFRATKPYFEKWIRMTIGVMLQPIFLFTYLALFLIALEVSLFTGDYSVYRSIACDAVDSPNFSIGYYTLANGQIQERAGPSALASMSVGQNMQTFGGTPAGATAQYGGIIGNEAVRSAGAGGSALFNSGAINVDLSVDAINIPQMAQLCNDMDPLLYVLRLILSFFATAAVIYIFYTMLQVIPYLGTLISSDLFGLPNLSNMIPVNSLSGNQLMHRLGFTGGGRR